MLAIATLLLLLRIPSAGGGETELGLPQILLIAGAIAPALAARGDGVLEGAPYPSKTVEVTKGQSPRRRGPRPSPRGVYSSL